MPIDWIEGEPPRKNSVRVLVWFKEIPSAFGGIDFEAEANVIWWNNEYNEWDWDDNESDMWRTITHWAPINSPTKSTCKCVECNDNPIQCGMCGIGHCMFCGGLTGLCYMGTDRPNIHEI